MILEIQFKHEPKQILINWLGLMLLGASAYGSVLIIFNGTKYVYKKLSRKKKSKDLKPISRGGSSELALYKEPDNDSQLIPSNFFETLKAIDSSYEMAEIANCMSKDGVYEVINTSVRSFIRANVRHFTKTLLSVDVITVLISYFKSKRFGPNVQAKIFETKDITMVLNSLSKSEGMTTAAFFVFLGTGVADMVRVVFYTTASIGIAIFHAVKLATIILVLTGGIYLGSRGIDCKDYFKYYPIEREPINVVTSFRSAKVIDVPYVIIPEIRPDAVIFSIPGDQDIKILTSESDYYQSQFCLHPSIGIATIEPRGPIKGDGKTRCVREYQFKEAKKISKTKDDLIEINIDDLRKTQSTINQMNKIRIKTKHHYDHENFDE